jgi:hypothetical protein
MKNSTEFEHDTKADTKEVVTKTGPLGVLLVFYFVISVLGIIALVLWLWWS